MKKYLQMCDKCLKKRESEEVMYDPHWVDEKLKELSILETEKERWKIERENYRQILSHYKNIIRRYEGQ